MNSQNQKTLSIVGGGLSGLLTAFYLIHDRKSRSLPLPKINLVVSQLYPACTLSSTATVALRGTSKGLSSLGDDLVDAFHEVENFLRINNPAGVVEGKLKTFNHPMSNGFEKTGKRYHNHPSKKETHDYISYEEKVFLFSPYKFCGWLYKELMAHVNFIQDTVIKVEAGKLVTLSGATAESDLIVFACGAYGPLLIDHEKMQKSQPVAGSYLEFQADYGEESFCQTYNELNCLYLHQDKIVLFGSASQDGFVLAPNVALLKERYQEWQDAHLLHLPAMEEGKIKTGIREKGRKREPYLFALNKEQTQWAVGGLYKNGYSLGFLKARQLSQMMEK
ncbi:MAG: FAD-dependent oxidoreductase [Bacteriovoracaceae bacterium]